MLLILPFIILFFASATIVMLQNNKIIAWASIAFAIVLLGSIVCIVRSFLNQEIFDNTISLDILNTIFRLRISFYVDSMGLIFAFMVAVLNVIATIYSVGYMQANNEKHQNIFFGFFNASILATLGIAFSANLITMFVFYEILTLSTYPLVVHNRDKEAYLGGKKYFLTLLSSSTLLLLPAIIITYHYGGGSFVQLGKHTARPKEIFMLIFLMFNFGVAKAALFPVHGWLTSAMVAPAPVSALLHAVAVVKSGVFVLLRIYTYIFFLQGSSIATALMLIAGATIMFAAICALKAKKLKSMLAYSTVSQLSYILIISSLFTENAIKIALYYIVSHACAKITLFFAVGDLYTRTQIKDIDAINGAFKHMPITGICFVVGAFAMIGLPPTAIFFLKHHLFVESVNLNNYFILIIITLSTGITSVYYLKVIYNAFFNDYKGIPFSKGSCLMKYAMLVTALLSISLSVVAGSLPAFSLY